MHLLKRLGPEVNWVQEQQGRVFTMQWELQLALKEASGAERGCYTL